MDLKTIEHDLEVAANALAKLKGIYDQVANSSPIHMIEAHFPGATALVERLGGYAGMAAAAPQAVAAIETAITAYEILTALGMKPATQDSLVWKRQEEQNRTGG